MMHYLFSRQHSFDREYREVYFAGETQNNQPENNEQRVEPTTERQNDAADLNASNVDQRSPEAAKKVIKATGDRQQQNLNILTNINGSLRKMTPQRTPEQLQKIQESKQRVADLKVRKAQLQAMSPEQRAVFLQKEMAQKTEKRKQEMAANKQEDDSDVPNQVFMNVPPEPVPPNGPNQQPQGPNNVPPQQPPAPPNAPNNQPPAGPDQSKLTQAERDQIVADAKADLGDLNALKKMKPEERDKKIAEVQAKHGVEVTEQNGTYKVDVAESKGDVAMNKMMGQFMKFALVLQRFKKMFEKFGGKKKEDEKKDEEKTPEEKNKEDGLQAMKDSGIAFDPADVLDNPDADEYVVKKDGERTNVPHFKFEDGKWKMQTDARLAKGEPWADSLSYTSNSVTDKWNELSTKLANANSSMKTAKDEKAASDKEKATLGAVDDSGVWKKPKEGGVYSFKKAKDGKTYRQNGRFVEVRDGDKWVYPSEQARIDDPKVAKIYDKALLMGGDKTWVTIPDGLTIGDGATMGVTRLTKLSSYSVDLQSNTLIGSNQLGYQYDYQPGTKKWESRAVKYIPGI